MSQDTAPLRIAQDEAQPIAHKLVEVAPWTDEVEVNFDDVPDLDELTADELAAHEAAQAALDLEEWEQAITAQPDVPASPPTTAKPARTPYGSTLANGDDLDVANALHDALLLQGYGDLVYTEGAVFGYRDGIFERIDDHVLDQLIIDLACTLYVEASDNRPVLPLKVNSGTVSGCVTMARKMWSNPTFFADAPAGIAFANGFVAFGEGGVLTRTPHTAAHRARYKYSHNFEPGAKPALWLRCLADWFGGDADCADKIAMLQERFAAAIVGIAPRYRQAFLHYGAGKNGKSVIMKIEAAMMPSGSVSYVEPRYFHDQYMLSDMANKRLNIAPDITADPISAAFKKFVTGEGVTARDPGGKVFHFVATAALENGFNPTEDHPFPKAADTSDGFYDRWQILSYNRRFDGLADNPTLYEDLLAELPFIITWALEGLPRLVAQRGYTTPASSKLLVAKWRGAGGNPVRTFIETRTRPTRPGESGTQAIDLLQAYDLWAMMNDMKPQTGTSLGRMLGPKGLNIRKTDGKATFWHVILLD